MTWLAHARLVGNRLALGRRPPGFATQWRLNAWTDDAVSYEQAVTDLPGRRWVDGRGRLHLGRLEVQRFGGCLLTALLTEDGVLRVVRSEALARRWFSVPVPSEEVLS